MRLHCLHGFLGSPHDWDNLGMALNASEALVKADLFGDDYFPEAASMPAWAEAYYQHEILPALTGPMKSGNYLLGYSLGGRLALHLAAQHSELWDGIIIVGANPGLDSAEARALRRTNDETWAKRFETEPWEPLLAAWDAQPVFAGRPSKAGERREEDFSRVRLAGSLRRWSLGAQIPLWEALNTLSCPLLWIAGVEDAGQVAICRRVKETIPQAEVWVAENAGHRVPWEQPAAFTARVLEFLEATQHRIELEKEEQL
ncbi:MAG: alpha/beta fold hydrolase [Janthinobacterium lividum]